MSAIPETLVRFILENPENILFLLYIRTCITLTQNYAKKLRNLVFTRQLNIKYFRGYIVSSVIHLIEECNDSKWQFLIKQDIWQDFPEDSAKGIDKLKNNEFMRYIVRVKHYKIIKVNANEDYQENVKARKRRPIRKIVEKSLRNDIQKIKRKTHIISLCV
ncbi:hypothetical protein RFI_32619 [Reticulomyxa filosa]|uniref:Uncharacterized protein n=1 Tax=Reticulomyxa filosa TaxID=46433 RepID=X6LUG4_RETFI|nr:hypothetical protein RFI_32619 [Reticulomyxa filosa]|eukprot:ETO04777.1 hypothetical protein RFI_32619 [Reticulomyxa filosa]